MTVDLSPEAVEALTREHDGIADAPYTPPTTALWHRETADTLRALSAEVARLRERLAAARALAVAVPVRSRHGAPLVRGKCWYEDGTDAAFPATLVEALRAALAPDAGADGEGPADAGDASR